MQRRDFLKLSATSLLMLSPMVGAWPRYAFAGSKGREFLVFCNSDTDEISPEIPATDPGTLQCVDRGNGEHFSIDIPFLGHAVTQNPGSPHQVMTFEKWGKRGVLVDVNDRNIVSDIIPNDGYLFFGHSSFTHDGDFFIVAEDTHDHKNGILAVRNSKTLKIERILSSYGNAPHECKILGDGKTILAATQGNPDTGVKPGLVWINLEDGKLIDKKEYESIVPAGQSNGELHGAAYHFGVTHDGWVVCGGTGHEFEKTHIDGTAAPEKKLRRAFVFFVSPQGHFYYPELPHEIRNNMKGEGLSIAVLGNTGLAAITISAASLCLVFDYKNQKMVHYFTAQNARGVVPLQDRDDAGHGVILLSDQGLFEGHLDPGPSSEAIRMKLNAWGNGKHLTRMYV